MPFEKPIPRLDRRRAYDSVEAVWPVEARGAIY